MYLKRLLLASVVASMLLARPAFCGQVIAWVAPYSVAASQTMLQRDFGGVGMKDGLSYLALQFWITNGPTLSKDGNISSANFDPDVTWFRDWGHKYGINVELCVDNYVNGWSWPEAVRSFETNRSAFVKSIAAEVNRLGLDGVDLDFEGTITLSTTDTDAYYAFAAELSDSMHAHQKHVTVASFSAQWNAPNWDMWPTLFQSVDGVTSMGYDQSGLATDYAAQVQHASGAPQKFMIGMPGYSGSWLGNTVTQQIDWVVANGKVGLGIWDATLSASAWQTADVWNRLKTIRNESATPVQSLASFAERRVDKKEVLKIVGSEITMTAAGPVSGDVVARIYDPLGRQISLIHGLPTANGSLAFQWNKQWEARGFYTVVVHANGRDLMRGFLLVN